MSSDFRQRRMKAEKSHVPGGAWQSEQHRSVSHTKPETHARRGCQGRDIDRSIIKHPKNII